VKIIALEKDLPGRTPDEFTPSLKRAEAIRVWELQQSGVLREIYFRQERSSAILILECEHADAARQVLATLPLVQAGLIDFEVIPLVPYTGFARLFTLPADN
jgi:muconolactone delta-isomerase